MKSMSRNILTTTLTAITLIAVGACAEKDEYSAEPRSLNIIETEADGTTSFISYRMNYALTGDFSFSDTELEMLLHMKEEEKLARDVYTALYEKWGIPIFSNISRAEQTHMNAVLFLLNKYGTEYTAGEDPGKFSNPDFQKLYDQLVAKGSESLAEAMKTGALIEDLDIKDLMDYLEKVTNENIIMVFENLTKGSRNHLRAFNRQLVALGITYAPSYISQEEFDKIINSPHETGNAYIKGRYGRPYRGRW